MSRKELLYLLAALAIGGALWFVVNLDPIWPFAWFVPGLLFAVALKTEGWSSRGLVAIASLIGAASQFRYLLSVMPLLPVMLILLLQTLMWVLIYGSARRIVKAYGTAWTVLALPIVAVAVDTLLAHFTPDGNWGSLAYTQAEVLPIAQLASVFGVGGVLFLVMLGNSAVALALVHGNRLPGWKVMYPAVVATVALAVVFGSWRLNDAPPGTPLTFGIASVDDYIEGPRSPKSPEVWAQYQAQVQELAASGAQLVLLPEKIDVLRKDDAEQRKAWLAQQARDNQVWLVAGVGVIDGGQKRNEAWWFAPDGRLATNYLKHFMAPPERDFVAGSEFPVNDIAGVRYGVAICKDMHFSSLGREFGRRQARVMLVPAWDFKRDAVMAANMTKMRGVESGFSVVRSSRAGLLSITDAYGRVLAVDRSEKLPGTTLFATVDVSAPLTTLYTRIGDALGWACVLAAIALTLTTFRRLRAVRRVPGEESGEKPAI
jgi:apolipoprotein N-acyltransferase